MHKKNNKTKDIFNNNSMHLFTMLCGYFLILLVLYSIFQILKIVNLNLINTISIITPIVIYLFVCKNKSIRIKTIIVSIFLFLIIILPFLYSKTYDLTDDGNSYHKQSIAYIKNGWNPLYETVEEYQKKNNKVVPVNKIYFVDIWMEHYPKASWIIAGTMYSFTGNIESGKCIVLIICIMLMIITYNCLSKILDKKWSYLLSLLILINPITIVQLFTYYIDGVLGMLFIIEILLLMNLSKENNIIKGICLTSIAAIMVNIKFTGLLYSGLIAAIYYFYILIKERNIKTFKRITIPFIIVYVTAIFIVGANTYLKNTIDHKVPLYPLMGKDKVDIISKMQPKSFKNKNSLEKFTISLFSKSENVTYDYEPTLKFPLRVYKDELKITVLPDARIGGFGPLFSAIFIISIITILIALIKIYKEKDKLIIFLFPIISIIISSILVGESWWARYVPQLYYLPIIAIILVLYIFKNKKIIPSLITILLILNSLFFIYGTYNSLRNSYIIDKQINKVKNSIIVKTKEKYTYGLYYIFDDHNINYEIDDSIKEEDSYYIYDGRIMIKK